MYLHLAGVCDHTLAGPSPICGIPWFEERKRQPGSITEDTPGLPSSDQGLNKRACCSQVCLSFTEGQLIDPRSSNQAGSVKVGDGLVQIGFPGIDDGTIPCRYARGQRELGGAFRVRPEVDRPGEGIVHLCLESMTHGVTQGELSRVVVALANRGECIQRRIDSARTSTVGLRALAIWTGVVHAVEVAIGQRRGCTVGASVGCPLSIY